VGIVSIVTWIPTIVARTFLDTQDITVIRATEFVFYLNTFFDPLIYVLGERVLNMVPWLNPTRDASSKFLTRKSNINSINGETKEVEL
jgi:hypothetical protein